MTALLLASMSGYGIHLLYTAGLLGWSGIGPAPFSPTTTKKRLTSSEWMTQAGLGSVAASEFVQAEFLLHRFPLRRIDNVDAIDSRLHKTRGRE
jgi:hypothetical protein